VTPSQDLLGTINGLAWTVATIASTPGPAVSTSLFSLSHERNILGGYFVYVVFLLVSFLSLWLTSTLPTETRPLSLKQKDSDYCRHDGYFYNPYQLVEPSFVKTMHN